MKNIILFVLLIAPAIIYSQSDYSLEYNHYYSWNEEGLRMEVTVIGKVPFQTGTNFAVMTKCQNVTEDSLDNLKPVSELVGEGEVTAKGKMICDNSNEIVEMTFEVPVKIKLKGKTWWTEGNCAEMWNLSYEEYWTEEAIWQVKADDPEAAAIVKSFLPLKLGNQVNKLTEKSLEFQRYPFFLDHPPFLKEAAFTNMGVPMKGTISYKINLPGSHKLGGENDEQYDINEIQPHRDYGFIDLHWGPPLDQIKWDTVDLDKLPK